MSDENATMDPLMGGNYNDVPDVIPQIPVGVYDWQVTKVEQLPNKNKNGYNLVISSRVHNDCDSKGMANTLYLSLPNSADEASALTFKRVRIKQFFTACGIAPEANGGFDKNKLVGAIYKGSVSPRMYSKDGVQKETIDVQVLKPNGQSF